MEYDLISFTNRIIELFANSPLLPYMNGDYTNKFGYTQSDEKKHPNRYPTHLKDVAIQSINSSTVIGEDTITFDYGNAVMETNYPYYHILQQAPTIRKRGRGNAKTKGSEDMYKIKAQRDYERVYWNGKTFTKEYTKNVRGSRKSVVDNSTRVYRFGGTIVYLNKDANSYRNIHYQYIDKIVDSIVPIVAEDFGLKLKRTQDSGLIDEFANQEGVSIEQVLEAFDSLM